MADTKSFYALYYHKIIPFLPPIIIRVKNVPYLTHKSSEWIFTGAIDLNQTDFKLTYQVVLWNLLWFDEHWKFPYDLHG